MIGYVTLGTNDLPRAVAFYEKLFEINGAQQAWKSDRGVGWGTSKTSPSLAVMTPYDGQAATVGNGTMVAIIVDSRDKVDALHRRALELGGRDEGPVGERFPGFYAGYFRDLEGNKLAVFCTR